MGEMRIESEEVQFAEKPSMDIGGIRTERMGGMRMKSEEVQFSEKPSMDIGGFRT